MTDEEKVKPADEAAGGLAGALAMAMANRNKAVHGSDDDDDDVSSEVTVLLGLWQACIGYGSCYSTPQPYRCLYRMYTSTHVNYQSSGYLMRSHHSSVLVLHVSSSRSAQ